MRFVRTITIEINDEGKYLGEIWGIKEDRAKEIEDLLTSWIQESNRWSEIYKRIFSELDGNEAIFAFGLLNYMWGFDDGQMKALRIVTETLDSGRAGA